MVLWWSNLTWFYIYHDHERTVICPLRYFVFDPRQSRIWYRVLDFVPATGALCPSPQTSSNLSTSPLRNILGWNQRNCVYKL